MLFTVKHIKKSPQGDFLIL